MRLWDQQELAATVCGLDDNQYAELLESDDLLSDLDQLVFDKMGVSFAQFVTVAEHLLPFTNPVLHALSDDRSHAFVKGNVMLLHSKVSKDNG